MLLRSSRRPTPPATMREAHLPAPLGGLNTLNSGTAMPISDCIQLYNMIPAEYGLRARLGYREWATGLTGAGDNYVRTILPFTGSAANGANDKIFATTSTGIWDVTDSGASAPAWATSTTYAIGDWVEAGSTFWVCVQAGESHPSNPMPTVWAPLTAYSGAAADRVVNGDNVYTASGAGTSAAGDGPTGTGTGIVDGTAHWNYEGPASSTLDLTVRWRHEPDNVEPTQVFFFGSTSGRTGHGVCHVQVTSAGHFLFYWDEVNGLHIYADTAASGGLAGTWTAVTALQITGVDPANLVFGTVFKGRVFHIERDTAKVWYTAAGAIFGAASALNLGFKLKAGGPLVGCWNWTRDGGNGVDDKLVLASAGGDIAVYGGEDPSSANSFGAEGFWGVGALPAGRDLATDLGGDLLIATRSGIVSMSRLVSGDSAQYQTDKIANLFNAAMLSKATTAGWTMRLHPEEAALIVTVPVAEGEATTQLAMSLNTKGWSQLRDLPIYSSNVWGGKFYFGTVDGKVCINDGYKDGITLAAPDEWTAVQYAGLSSFQNLGSMRRKQVQLIRGLFLGEESSPVYTMAARYDFDMSELATVTPGVGTGDAWDSAVWDTAVWGGQYAPSSTIRGAVGNGINAAIAWRGAATGRTLLVAFDVGYTVGGFL